MKIKFENLKKTKDEIEMKLVKKKNGEIFEQNEVDELLVKALRVEDLDAQVENLGAYKSKFEDLDQKYSVLVIFFF